MPEVLSGTNMTELTNNHESTNMTSSLINVQSMNMTSNQDTIMTSFTSNQGANLTSLVVMVPTVCPTALRKSHWYTRYDTIIVLATLVAPHFTPVSESVSR